MWISPAWHASHNRALVWRRMALNPESRNLNHAGPSASLVLIRCGGGGLAAAANPCGSARRACASGNKVWQPPTSQIGPIYDRLPQNPRATC